MIGGLSLGGYVSLAFYGQHPERTEALMLFDTGPGFKKDASREAWNETAEKRARALEADGFDALGTSPEVRKSNHRSAQGLARAARGMLAQFDSSV
ncbi:MAG: alpha/beta hydrolase, partial [Chloroflexi bacterium]|nr:alpha/beta hydrolase [Chloroflexota bacterium]